jgi:hypothetical protein
MGMNRLKFIDRMSQGRISRRDVMRSAAAFGIGMTLLPTRSRAEEQLTVMEWSGYDQPEFFKSYVDKHGSPPAFSIFANEDEALQKVRSGLQCRRGSPLHLFRRLFRRSAASPSRSTRHASATGKTCSSP